MDCVSLGAMVAHIGRLFTFGCSFTNYYWQTWADILGAHWVEFQNWGQSGAGNHYILNAIMECDQRHQFQPQDTVVVCWTNVMREDRYVDGRGWITCGNVGTASVFTRDFVADMVTERGYIIRDIAFIKAALYFLISKQVTWKFLSLCPFSNPDPWDDRIMHHSNDVYTLYADVLDHILPSYIEVLGRDFWQHNQERRFRNKSGQMDYHPLPSEHLKYLDTVLPGWVRDNQIRQLALQDQVTSSGYSDGTNQNTRL